MDKTIGEDRIGVTKTMRNGEKATVIAYKNDREVIIEFEDGSTKKCAWHSFFYGCVRNPNYYKNRAIGRLQMMNNGLMAKIIDYKTSKDITVEFETGEIVEHVDIGNFDKGELTYKNAPTQYNTSLDETALRFYLEPEGFVKVNANVIDFPHAGKYYFDLFSKERKIAIEYDGYHHNSDNVLAMDHKKNLACMIDGIHVIRFRYIKVLPLKDGIAHIYDIDSKRRLSKSFEDALKQMCVEYGIDIDIDFNRDKDDIYDMYRNQSQYRMVIGSTVELADGITAEVVAYRNTNDIDVKLSNGVVLEHVTYTNFKRGEISTFRDRHLHEKAIMNNGLECEIIGYKDLHNKTTGLVVQFENGDIVNTSYRYFKRGMVGSPLYKKQQCAEMKMKLKEQAERLKSQKAFVGMKALANCGQMMEIIEIHKESKGFPVDIRFDDGTVVKNKRLSSFKSGKIGNPNAIANKRIGEQSYSSSGEKMTIVDYYPRQYKNTLVKFEDGTEVLATYEAFCVGYVAKP